MTSKAQRATLDDGRHVPETRWVHFGGRQYRVRGYRVEVMYVRKSFRGNDFQQSTVFRDLDRESKRYDVVLRQAMLQGIVRRMT